MNMTDMKRVTITLPDSLDAKILNLRKSDEYVRFSYAEIVRRVLEHGLSHFAEEEQARDGERRDSAWESRPIGAVERRRGCARLYIVMRFPGSRSELSLLMYAAFCCFGGNHLKSPAIAAMAAIVEIIRLSPGDRCFRWLAAVGSLPE